MSKKLLAFHIVFSSTIYTYWFFFSFLFFFFFFFFLTRGVYQDPFLAATYAAADRYQVSVNCKMYYYSFVFGCIYQTLYIGCPVGWGCRMHRLNLCRGMRPSPSVLDMIINDLMMRFQWCWSFAECHHSQVHSDPKWWHLIGSYLWIK